MVHTCWTNLWSWHLPAPSFRTVIRSDTGAMSHFLLIFLSAWLFICADALVSLVTLINLYHNLQAASFSSSSSSGGSSTSLTLPPFYQQISGSLIFTSFIFTGCIQNRRKQRSAKNRIFGVNVLIWFTLPPAFHQAKFRQLDFFNPLIFINWDIETILFRKLTQKFEILF